MLNASKLNLWGPLMKLLASALLFLLSSGVFATECPVDAVEVESQISSAQSCYEAAKIARDCAWGSSIDVSFVAAAGEICLKSYDSWSDKHKIIMSTLIEDCQRKYENESGSLYRSMTAFCSLGVIEVLSGLNEEVL